MKNKLLIIVYFCAALLFAGCIPSQYTKGVDADEYPEKDLPVYDDAVIFEYEEDDDEVTIKYGTEDDVDDIMDFYQDYFEDNEIVLDDEDEDKDEYSAEGFYEDFLFEINVEESRRESEKKVFSSVVEVEIEFLSKNEIEEYENSESGIESMAERSYAISNTQVIISCVNAHNAIAKVDVTFEFISYDELMSIDTLDEFNFICEFDLSGMKDEEFNITKGYILKDSDGSLTLNEDYDHTK